MFAAHEIETCLFKVTVTSAVSVKTWLKLHLFYLIAIKDNKPQLISFLWGIKGSNLL